VTRFSNTEKWSEAAREVEMRGRVYGRKGQLTPTDKKRIAIMQEIVEDYAALIEQEELL
jgi:hypothetical protein